MITALRNIRGEMNLPPGEQIAALLRTKNEEAEKRLREINPFIQTLARIKGAEDRVRILKSPSTAPLLSSGMLRSLSPWTGLRMEEEMKRLEKEIRKDREGDRLCRKEAFQ